MAAAVVCLNNIFIVPLYAHLRENQQIMFSITVLFPGYVLRSICRLVSENVVDFVSVTKLFALSAALDISMKLEYRFLQAYITDTTWFIILSLIHALISFVERVSLLVCNYFYMWMASKCCCSGHVRPITQKTKRLMADLILIGFISEVAGFLLTNTLVQFFAMIRKMPLHGENEFSYKSYGIDYAKRTLISAGIEFFFIVLAIFILTNFVNLPLVKLWKKHWKRITFYCFLTMALSITYSGRNLVAFAFPDVVDDPSRVFNCTKLDYLFS